MADSVSTFCVLFRHALRLGGEQTIYDKHDIVAAASKRFGIDETPFRTLLDVRKNKVKAKEVNPGVLFPEYLRQIQVVVSAVDQLNQ
jgi:hypothetical protein